MPSNYTMKYCVDIAMVIDATGSMGPLLDTVKNNALNFYSDLMRAMNEKGKKVHEVRVRVIAFRDYLADGKEAMLASGFFTLPDEAADFEELVKSITPFGGGDDRIRGEERLLLCIRMGAGKLIVFPDNTDRGIDPVSGFRDLRRQLRSVGITDHIRAPLFCHLQGKLLIACFTGKRETAGSVILHCDSPVLCPSVVRDSSLYCILPDRNSRFRAFFTDCIAVSPINLFQL